MASLSTILGIHRDPAQLSPLQQQGYNLLTATTGHEGLRLFMTRPVDAVLIEYHLGLLNGGLVAAQMKKVNPEIPVLMLIDHLEVPDGALRSVNMVVAKLDGDDFLLSAVKHVLDERPAPDSAAASLARTSRNNHLVDQLADNALEQVILEQVLERNRSTDLEVSFSRSEWLGILDGTTRFASTPAFPRLNSLRKKS